MLQNTMFFFFFKSFVMLAERKIKNNFVRGKHTYVFTQLYCKKNGK